MNFFEKFFSPKDPEVKYYLTMCCIVKDEDDYLAEWINFHLKTGVEHFYIYDNDSRVPAKDVISRAGFADYVTVIEMPGKSKLVPAYRHCLKKYGPYSKWISFLDMDEFIVAKTTKGNLPEFLKPYEQFAALAINWQLFGSGHHMTRTNLPQAESYILKAEENFHVNRHIKSIVQPKYVKDAGNAHFFKFKKGWFAVNENMQPVEGSHSDVSVSKIQVNHYYCRSFEEYEEKIRRGRADSKRERTMEEFHHHDSEANNKEDKTILQLFN